MKEVREREGGRFRKGGEEMKVKKGGEDMRVRKERERERGKEIRRG